MSNETDNQCDDCNGTGEITFFGNNGDTCPRCKGWGGYNGAIAGSGGASEHEMISVNCEVCNNTGYATGETVSDNCTSCNGTGVKIKYFS